jgi:hypothetical protein
MLCSRWDLLKGEPETAAAAGGGITLSAPRP